MKKFAILFVLLAFVVVAGCAGGTYRFDGPAAKAVSPSDCKTPAPPPPAPAPVAAPAPKVAPAPIIVYFDFDKSNIRDSEKPKIDQAVKLLKADPTAECILEGNTDPYGTDVYNMELGKRRSVAVKKALEAQGIDPKRTKTVSFGETKLADPKAKGIAANEINRRTVVVIKIK